MWIDLPARGWFRAACAKTYCGQASEAMPAVIDLATREGRASLEALIAGADVLLQNLKPGSMDKLGFSLARLRKDYPRLVCCTITGYGDDGPYAHRKAYDMLLQAESGKFQKIRIAHESSRLCDDRARCRGNELVAAGQAIKSERLGPGAQWVERRVKSAPRIQDVKEKRNVEVYRKLVDDVTSSMLAGNLTPETLALTAQLQKQIAGDYGGLLDLVVQRLVDIWIAFPPMLPHWRGSTASP